MRVCHKTMTHPHLFIGYLIHLISYSSDILFIGLRRRIGTFLLYGLRTEFKRKLDLTVVALPLEAGTL